MTALEITRPDPRRAALEGLIDYAGLFPPASLDMTGAVTGYRAARLRRESWMVRRFIVPASRLEELVAALVPSMTDGEEPWPLSVVFDAGDWPRGTIRDAVATRSVLDPMGPAVVAELAEVRLPVDAPVDPADVESVATAADPAMALFEVPWAPQSVMAADLAVLAGVRLDTGRALGAKIRCGGVTAEAFPPVGALAAFLVEAARHGLAVKATAGLHHPHRHTDPSTGFTHHGFLNVLAAATLAAVGGSADEVVGSLLIEEPDRLALDRRGLHVDGTLVAVSELVQARRDLFVGYGSCSFDEPVEDLVALGVLPVA